MDYVFDDQSFWKFGTIIHEVTHTENRSKREQTRGRFFLAAAVAVAASIFFINADQDAWTQHKAATQRTSRIGGVTAEKLRREVARYRDFLALTQGQLAKALGLSVSTIEKFEQGLVPTIESHTAKKYEAFVEYAELLIRAYDNKKFICREMLNTPLDVLGDQSPLEFAGNNPETGIFEILGLERRMHG